MLTLRSLPKDITKYANVISEKVVNWHHDKHQAGYVAKYNEIIEELSKVNKADSNANFSYWGELKRRQSFNLAGVILHENYWRIFGSDGVYDEKYSIIQKIIADFGSIDLWREDFIATGKSALGWVVCVWDSYTDKIVNVSVDYHNIGTFWDSIVIIACDVFEHAYYSDYGPDRAKYLENFVASLDWMEIEKGFTGDFNSSSSGCGGNCGSAGGCGSNCSGDGGCSGNCGTNEGENQACCGDATSSDGSCCGKCADGKDGCSCSNCEKEAKKNV